MKGKCGFRPPTHAVRSTVTSQTSHWHFPVVVGPRVDDSLNTLCGTPHSVAILVRSLTHV